MTIMWEAIYNDNKLLQEKDSLGEHKFSEIDMDKLKEFRLFHNNKVISFFPKTATFGINGLLYNTALSNRNLDYRLIFFIRRRKELGGNSIEDNTYHLGFQVNIDGICQKRILKIRNNELFMNELID